MDAWLIWFICAAVAAIAEMLIPGFYMLSLSAACVGGCIASLFHLSLTWQIVFALVFLVVCALFIRPLLYKKDSGYQEKGKVVGQIITITEDVVPPDKGRGILSGVEWAVSAQEEMHKGDKAVVVSVGGAVLEVRKAD